MRRRERERKGGAVEGQRLCQGRKRGARLGVKQDESRNMNLNGKA
jgi:hypothetical protein